MSARRVERGLGLPARETEQTQRPTSVMPYSVQLSRLLTRGEASCRAAFSGQIRARAVVVVSVRCVHDRSMVRPRMLSQS
jgi:hypothetical protein